MGLVHYQKEGVYATTSRSVGEMKENNEQKNKKERVDHGYAKSKDESKGIKKLSVGMLPIQTGCAGARGTCLHRPLRAELQLTSAEESA